MNTIVLAINWYRKPEKVNQVTDIINYVFTGVFTLEAVLKIYGFGIKKYFSDGWNIFDFAIIVGSYTGLIVDMNTSVSVGVQTTILRAFRISRILRLIKRAKSLNIIFETFIITIPALANIGGLLLLLLYLYSIIGVQLFAPVMLQADLNRNANFQTFFNSFMTLFRCSTGENWNDIMHDITRQRSEIFQCLYNPTYDDYKNNGKAVGCGNIIGQVFLTSFILIVQLIFLNLFIAIILQGFDFMNKKANMILKDNDLFEYKEQWAQFDPKGTGFMKIEDFKDFLKKIGEPLGFDSITAADPLRQKEYISNLDLCTYNKVKYYNFYDCLRKLSKHLIMKITIENEKNLNIKTGKKIFNKLRSELNFENTDQCDQIEAIRSLTKTEIKIDKYLEKISDKFTPLHYKAALIILNVFRRFKRKKNAQMKRADSIRHMIADRIVEFEDQASGFKKDKKGDRFVNVVLNTTKQNLKNSKIQQLLRGSLTIIEEDQNSKIPGSSNFDIEDSISSEEVQEKSFNLRVIDGKRKTK